MHLLSFSLLIASHVIGIISVFVTREDSTDAPVMLSSKRSMFDVANESEWVLESTLDEIRPFAIPQICQHKEVLVCP